MKYLTVKMAINKKDQKNAADCMEKGETLTCSWKECNLEQLLWKTVWRSSKKFKIELQYDPATGYICNENEISVPKKIPVLPCLL
jgi:hypothetical protein